VTGPLDGLKVVDLTHALAGPYTTMLLADLGADVLKVEPRQGDMARGAVPIPPGRRHVARYDGVSGPIVGRLFKAGCFRPLVFRYFDGRLCQSGPAE
jgi:CoA transferase family III